MSFTHVNRVKKDKHSNTGIMKQAVGLKGGKRKGKRSLSVLGGR